MSTMIFFIKTGLCRKETRLPHSKPGFSHLFNCAWQRNPAFSQLREKAELRRELYPVRHPGLHPRTLGQGIREQAQVGSPIGQKDQHHLPPPVLGDEVDSRLEAEDLLRDDLERVGELGQMAPQAPEQLRTLRQYGGGPLNHRSPPPR